jgi:hypothetical protein
MLTLPDPVWDRLLRVTRRLRWQGREATPEQTLAVILVFFTPSDPAVLLPLLYKPHPALRYATAALPTSGHMPPLGPSGRRRVLHLPSPATLKVNALIDGLAAVDVFVSRRQVMSASIVHAVPSQTKRLAAAYDAWPHTPAAAAGVVGRPLQSVLTLNKPTPGRRPRS